MVACATSLQDRSLPAEFPPVLPVAQIIEPFFMPDKTWNKHPGANASSSFPSLRCGDPGFA
jgi:hypothetical protein